MRNYLQIVYLVYDTFMDFKAYMPNPGSTENENTQNETTLILSYVNLKYINTQQKYFI